jgi:hypothetical protein
MEQQIMELLLGNTGAGALVALVMKGIKSGWKLDKAKKALYWIPAVLLSAVSALGIFWYLEIWHLGGFILVTAFVAAFQLLTENEAWPQIRKVFLVILSRLLKKA